MPYFGDVYIPFLTDKNTDITKDVVEKNFVDEPPHVYELTADLESGTYSAILNESYHDKNESFEEQQYAVLSMVTRHGTEFPFEIAGDKGYALVESGNVTVFPSLEVRDAEIEVRFLDESDYNSAVRVSPSSFDEGDYSLDPVESFVVFPSGIDVSGYTANFQLTTEDGTIDAYLISSDSTLEFSENSNDHTLSQQHSICKLFDSSGNRIYSGEQVTDLGSAIKNSLIDVDYDVSTSSIDYYNGSAWESIGQTSLGYDAGYASVNTNDRIDLEFVNDLKSSVFRGFSAVEYTFTNDVTFAFEPTNSFTEQIVANHYSHYQDGNGNDIVLIRTDSDGSFYSNSTEIGIQNLDSSKDYTVFVGIVPSAVAVSDYVRYVYNFGTRRRTFTQV